MYVIACYFADSVTERELRVRSSAVVHLKRAPSRNQAVQHGKNGGDTDAACNQDAMLRAAGHGKLVVWRSTFYNIALFNLLVQIE